MEIQRITDYLNVKGYDNISATAGGSGDNTASLTSEIDIRDYETAIVIVGGTATLGEDETLKATVKTQEASSSGGSYSDKTTLATTATLATGGSGGSTEEGVVAYRVDLTGHDGYLKVETTPDLSAANTDTATLFVTVILGGGKENPQTLAVAF